MPQFPDIEDRFSGLSSLVRAAIDQPLPPVIPRVEIIDALPAPDRANPVEVITGVRKCGKTFYLFQMMQQLIQKGFPAKRLFYFNFEDLRLFPFGDEVIVRVVDEFWKQVPLAREKGCYLFLDDVQETRTWREDVARIAREEVVTIICGGSLLHSPFGGAQNNCRKDRKFDTVSLDEGNPGSAFALRFHELLPLSFREYCSFQGHNVPDPSDTISDQSRTRMEVLFGRYLEEGGFPGTQTKQAAERIETIQGYLVDSLDQEIQKHLGRDEAYLAKQFLLHGLRNTGHDFSINQLVESLKEHGSTVYWNKGNKILELLQEARLLIGLEEHSAAQKQKSTSTLKVYSVDSGASFAVTPAGQHDRERLFKTAVFLELYRRQIRGRLGAIASYSLPGRAKRQVDFYVEGGSPNEGSAIIQACMSLQDQRIRDEQIELLNTAMETIGFSQATLLTLRDEETITTDAGTIHVLPAWKWSLL